MAIKTQNITIDLDVENYNMSFFCKQLDDIILEIQIIKNSVPVNILNNDIRLYCKKSNNLFVQQKVNITIINAAEGKIRIKCKQTLFDSVGTCIAELELVDSLGIITTANFYYYVNEKAVNFNNIGSIVDIDSIRELEIYIKEAKAELQNFKNSLAALNDLVTNKDSLIKINNEAKQTTITLTAENIKALENIKELNNLDVVGMKNKISANENEIRNIKAFNPNSIKIEKTLNESINFKINDISKKVDDSVKLNGKEYNNIFSEIIHDNNNLNKEMSLTLGNIIIKVGYFFIDQKQTRTYNFPTPFPNNCLFSMVSNQHKQGNGYWGACLTATLSRTSITAYNDNNLGIQCVYFSIGN